MSRIGKKTIKIPSGVEINVNGREINVKGPKGELHREFLPVLDFKIENGQVLVGIKEGALKTKKEANRASKIWGLGRAMLANMIKGVTNGFEKTLEFNGVGFKAQVKGDSIELSLGFSHTITVKAPQGVTFQVEKNLIKISGIDNEKIGQVAALIRSKRPPEPYKGSGIKYKNEIILRKAGKKAATAGA
jgi:large subunit ribosomal protein L6